MLFLEPVQDIGGGDGVQALVVDLTDRRLLADDDVENDAIRGIFPLDLEILEVSGIPERVKIALDRRSVVRIALVGEKPGEDRLLGDAAVADDPNLPDDVLLRPGGQGWLSREETSIRFCTSGEVAGARLCTLETRSGGSLN